MPFKTLQTPRKVMTLDAEIRGAAWLGNPSFVAMVSTDPVRLAIVPFGGSGAKTLNVSLDAADEVAVLSRDTALVRTSDHAIWALLDVTHTGKVEQVGRDIRALCMRPAGESALGIGWDGSATSYSIVGRDVEGRTFPVRGTIRACDVLEKDTFVVVDGADGGQLRVHPGATPEPGAAVKTSLPQAAASLDRIKGGIKTCAIFKRGQQNVCIATGGPNRYTAKMVRLEDKPIDIAVVETTLVAIYADGRVALYDGATLDGAGDAPMTASATVSLGTQGEPRVVLAVTKGSPTLWFGTSAGSVVSAPMVRKQG